VFLSQAHFASTRRRSPSVAQESPSVALQRGSPAVTSFGVNATDSGTIAEKLSQSQILRDYERAFSEATGLPLKFSPAGKKRPGMRGSAAANKFCTQMAESEPGCRMCVDTQEKLSAASSDGTTQSAACIAGLTDSTVPVRVGDKVLGFLQTGQIALKKLTPADFRRVSSFLKKAVPMWIGRHWKRRTSAPA
jgi:ligand-binding sensor protein